MAQGTGKLKTKSHVGLKKDKNRMKKQQLKKGARFIAPKKAKNLEQAKLKKGLEKAIKMNIEQEITSKVKSVEAKGFHVVQAPTSSADGKTKDSANSGKSKKK